MSSVVLTSLSGARESARKANIISSLNNANTQATLYYNDNGNYDGVCNDQNISQIVDSLKSTGEGAACWEATESYSNYRAELADFDYGIAVTSDDTYYATSPYGAVTFDDTNQTGETNWSSEKQACSAAGGRLPTASELRALSDINGDDSTPPEGFDAGYHWSISESWDSSKAYRVGVDNGYTSHGDKSSNDHYVRCVQ